MFLLISNILVIFWLSHGGLNKSSAASFASLTAVLCAATLAVCACGRGPAEARRRRADECVSSDDIDHVGFYQPGSASAHELCYGLMNRAPQHASSPFSEVSCCKQVNHGSRRPSNTADGPSGSGRLYAESTQRGGLLQIRSRRSPCSSDFTL